MLLKRKKHTRINEDIITVKCEGSVSNVIEEEEKIIIKLEQLPIESIKDKSRLMQITDNKVLARINDLVPELFQVGNTVSNTVQAVQTKGQVLYQAIIPSGVKLADSKDMAGAVRGIYHGTEGVKGHANLVAVQQNTNLATNVTASAMGVASMVVGQYYMTQINAELGKINDGITKVMDFQDNEYKSKVLALMTQIQKIAKFQADILGNDELRLSEIENLNRLENECIQLLGQANLTIAGYAKKKDLDYEAYEKELAEINKWFVYQKALIEIVVKMAEIKHTLYFGKISKEQCCALLDIYSKQVRETLEQLGEWHKLQIKKFEIHVDERMRKRIGIDGIIHFIPSLISEEQRYRAIPQNTMKNIITQMQGYAVPTNMGVMDLFQKDVRIILKDDKVFYHLPELK